MRVIGPSKNYKICVISSGCCGSRFESGTSRIRGRSVKQSIAMFDDSLQLIQLSNIAEGDGENNTDEYILLLFARLYKLTFRHRTSSI